MFGINALALFKLVEISYTAAFWSVKGKNWENWSECNWYLVLLWTHDREKHDLNVLGWLGGNAELLMLQLEELNKNVLQLAFAIQETVS